jgi:3-oxosteroid 1-dehydrogenase
MTTRNRTASLSESPSGSISRRGFLATIAAGGVAAGLPAFARAQDATPAADASPTGSPTPARLVETDLPASWDNEADVVVVGSGAAAFAAAVTAVQDGAEVIIVEKAESVGGTTQISGNAYWIPNNHLMRDLGLEDPREQALQYMARLAYPQLYDPEVENLGLPQRTYDLIATFYDTAAEAVETFEDWGALYSRISASFGYSEQPDISDPDYHADLPENAAPYGRTLNPDPEATDGLGTIPLQMRAWTDERGIPVLTSHRVTGVYQNMDRQVVGVVADNQGAEVNIRARKAVVFGSGGFTLDGDKSLNYLRGPVFAGCGVPTNTGDFVDIGIALGAELGNMNQAWWLQCPLELALESPSLPGADVWMPFGDSMIIVNKYGNRFMTEKITYNERGQSHFTWDPGKREYPNLVQFMIYDSGVAQKEAQWPFRWPVPMPGDDSDLVISGETWEELVENLSTRLEEARGKRSVSARIGPDVVLADDFLEQLQATVERFNQFAESGIDEDFDRGSRAIERAWHGPPREESMDNPTMYPFAGEGPYYCIMLGAMTLDTKGGPVTDTGARVQHVNGGAIEGLYAAGNCAASASGQAYWSAGGTLGPALAFGYLAGRNAAAEGEKAVG